MSRYQRQTQLPDVGEAGQQRLRHARVSIVGMGGLGCPAATYLVAAGVGHVVLIDDDVVAESNLARQVLFTKLDIGSAKVSVASENLRKQNPEVTITTHRERLTADNAAKLLQGSDVVIDATDHVQTKLAINDHCVASSLPWVLGGVTAFDGQVALLGGGRSHACYRCVFPTHGQVADDPGGTCATLGVVGMMCGVIGSLQALEALKFLVGMYDAKESRLHPEVVRGLLSVDGRTLQTQRFAIAPRRDCACQLPADEVAFPRVTSKLRSISRFRT